MLSASNIFRNKGYNMKKKLIYILAVTLCIILPVVGYIAVSKGENPFGPDSDIEYLRVIVTDITNTSTVFLDEEQTMSDTTYTFTATVRRGDRKGETLTATQLISSYAMFNPRPVSAGDAVIVYESIIGDGISWCFAEYVRSDAIIVLCVLFCLTVAIFGRTKGVKTLLSLALTLVSVFFILIPIILKGGNIYFWSIVVCVYITAMTLITVNGLTAMSLVAGIGCMGGVLISAAITVIMDVFLKLTGFTDEHAIYIQGIGDGSIDVKALVFAGIIIGAIGAVMDVAVNISASLHEISEKVKNASFRELYNSGLTISRDIIGTMSNTLILAYVGSSLCAVLLIIYNNSFSPLNLFNKENIIIEILKIIVGSFGILSALPLTSFISALFYSGKKKDKDSEKDEYVELLRSIDKE